MHSLWTVTKVSLEYSIWGPPGAYRVLSYNLELKQKEKVDTTLFLAVCTNQYITLTKH